MERLEHASLADGVRLVEQRRLIAANGSTELLELAAVGLAPFGKILLDKTRAAHAKGAASVPRIVEHERAALAHHLDLLLVRAVNETAVEQGEHPIGVAHRAGKQDIRAGGAEAPLAVDPLGLACKQTAE